MRQPAAWRVELLPIARRELLALRSEAQRHLRDAIRALADDPTPPDSIPMRGKGVGLHRLRVGNYRVIYRVQAERVRVLVIRIGRRSEVYRGYEDV